MTTYRSKHKSIETRSGTLANGSV